MANNVKIILLPVKDVEKAKKFYNTFLGTEPYVDSPYYIGYKSGELEVGLVPNSESIVSMIEVDDINASVKALKDAGGEVVSEPKDVAEGLLVAQVKDADGNVVGFRQQPKKS